MRNRFNQHISKTTGVATLVLVMMVVLFSSCNFRKSFEAYHSIPLTKTLNVLKATVNTKSICEAGKEIDFQQQITKEHKAALDLHLFPAAALPSLSVTSNYNVFSPASDSIFRGAIPLYILYSNLKICS